MMQFKCHCNVCQKVFGNSLHALAMPQDELEISGTLSHYFVTGGSGNKLHYNFCPNCGTFTYNKPDLLEPMIYVPARLPDGQIEFTLKVELWTSQKTKNISQSSSINVAFEDNGTTDCLMEMLENFDQIE